METPVFSACCTWTKASSLKVETAWRAPSPLSALIYNLACLTQAIGWWEILEACLSWGRYAALEPKGEGVPSPRPHPPGVRLPLAELWREEGEKVMAQETQTLILPTKMQQIFLNEVFFFYIHPQDNFWDLKFFLVIFFPVRIALLDACLQDSSHWLPGCVSLC